MPDYLLGNFVCHQQIEFPRVMIPYLVKGKQVYVEGTLSSQRWEGQDGEKRFSNNINLREIQFLDRSQNTADGSGTQESESINEEPDLPF